MVFQTSPHANYEISLALFDLISHEDWKLAAMRVKTSPHDASKLSLIKGFFDGEYDCRVLPIHQACALRPTKEFVQLLAETYPQGLKMREDTFHRLPLHIACLTNASSEVIEMLVHHFPEGARWKDSIGRLPIHYACAHNVPLEVVDILLHAFPAAAGCGDNQGWLPLHVACRRGLAIGIIQKLVDSFPQSVQMLTMKGSTPIMCAEKGQDLCHENVINFLSEYIQRQSISVGKSLDDPKVLKEQISNVRHQKTHAFGA